jgi:hypothetical protein
MLRNGLLFHIDNLFWMMVNYTSIACFPVDLESTILDILGIRLHNETYLGIFICKPQDIPQVQYSCMLS